MPYTDWNPSVALRGRKGATRSLSLRIRIESALAPPLAIRQVSGGAADMAMVNRLIWFELHPSVRFAWEGLPLDSRGVFFPVPCSDAFRTLPSISFECDET